MQQTTQGGEVLTIDGAAALLGVSPRTMRRWLKEKDIPFVRINRDIRILKSSLLAWIKQQEGLTMAAKHADQAGE